MTNEYDRECEVLPQEERKGETRRHGDEGLAVLIVGP